MASNNKNKKRQRRSTDKVYNDNWRISMYPELPSWFPAAMSICKILLILIVFCIASFQWGYTNDLLWQCVWSLSLVKLVELSD